MEAEMKSACIKAGAKAGIGLALVAAVIGIRIVTATPDGVASGIDALEKLDSEIAVEAKADESAASAGEASEEDSFVSRLGAGMREHLPASDSRSREGDRMVSCRLGGATQFMRADDCAMRGGESTIVAPDRR